MSSIFYFFKESLNGFSRNLGTTLGSIVTIFLSLLIIGVFLVGGVIVNNAVSSIEDKVSITAYVADEAEQTDIDAAMAEIEAMEGVASVSFTTKEQALEDFQESMSSSEIIEQLDGVNPLPASIEVELSDTQLVEEVADAIIASETFQAIADEEDAADSVKYGQDSVERLFELTKYIRYIGVALIALLIFIALVFINNTIRLSIMARSREISIMRLVGASNGFIRGPFIMEAVMHAVIGALLAIACIEVVRRLALPKVADALAWLPIDLSLSTYLLIYVALIVAGLFIAALGSFIAMRRYLKV